MLGRTRVRCQQGGAEVELASGQSERDARRARWRCLLVVFALVLSGQAWAADPKPDEPRSSEANQRLEQQFEEMLSGVVLVGQWTVDGKDDAPKAEKYTISKVTKFRDDYWLFNARIQYGDLDQTLPIPLEVKWAGDTPVITLTDLTIPGLGTFTSRVVIYRDRYAGTWQHGKAGGHLWGRIEKLP